MRLVYDDDLAEGSCPCPVVYCNEIEEMIIYDAEGNPFIPKKTKLGFDLSVTEEDIY